MATPIQKTATAGECVVLRDTNDDILIMQGTTVPSAVAGHAKGAIFLDTDVATGTSGVYFNKGTNLSCIYELAPVASTGTVTTLTATSTSANNLAAGANGTTNPTFNVDSSTGSVAAGLNVKGATAAGTVAVSVISSGANANLSLDAKGSGTVTIAGTSTGAVTITPATTITGALTATAGIAGKTIVITKETIAAGGTTTALALTATRHDIDSDAGGDTFTLADGIDGQLMIVVQKSATGISTVTPATLLSGTSVTMATAGASVMLMFQTTLGWSVIGGNAYTVV